MKKLVFCFLLVTGCQTQAHEKALSAGAVEVSGSVSFDVTINSNHLVIAHSAVTQGQAYPDTKSPDDTNQSHLSPSISSIN